MDQFTQIALARSRGTSFAEAAAPAEVEPAPTTIEERLTFTYPGGVPRAVARMLVNWELPDGRDFYQSREAGKAIHRELEARALAANKRRDESRDRIPEIESRLATLRAEYASLRAQLVRPPAPHLTPREVGLMEVDRAGYEKLIPAMEDEIERLRENQGQATREYKALWPLALLAGVIAGHLSRGVVSPSDFGFEYDWQLCAPSVRKEREKEFRAEEERKRAERERRRQENERFLAQREESAPAEEVEKARIDALDFAGLLSYLFFDGQELALAEVKQHAAGWDRHGLLKEAVRLWPEKLYPELWVAMRKEIAELGAERDELFRRAADRLARILQPRQPNYAAPLNQVAEAEEREPTLHEIGALDFAGLLNFILARKSITLDSLPTLKSVIEASPIRPAANTLEAASSELYALGYTESFLYKHALHRFYELVEAGLNRPWEGN